MTRLNASQLTTISEQIKRPLYDRAARAAVVHLGVGAFHRAHQAVCLDNLMASGDEGWMICGASLRSPAVADQLMPQDGLFTLAVRNGDTINYKVIGSLKDVLVGPDDPERLVAALASPDTQLVTLTITEKGYCLDPATGALRRDDPGIIADIQSPSTPQTAPGYLVAGLAERRAAGLGPFTILSCDNLPENGVRTRAAVIGLAGLTDPDLANWIAENGAFPSSMVDRIVPATTDEDLDIIEKSIGFRDEGAVKSEPFFQWVIEDWFCAERPALDKVGVTFTDRVAPWEKAKLRLLNGAHSALAYLGPLAGYEFVHTAIDAPGYAAFIEALWDESEATLDPIEGFDVSAYRQALLTRFQNSALAHKTRQIATDGSQKIPQRLLAPIRERIAMGMSSPALTVAVAAWLRWHEARDDAGAAFVVDDPVALQTAQIAESYLENPDGYVASMVGQEAVFGTDLISDQVFMSGLCQAFRDLKATGAADFLAGFKRSS